MQKKKRRTAVENDSAGFVSTTGCRIGSVGAKTESTDLAETASDTWEKLGPAPRVNYDAICARVRVSLEKKLQK
jgi:hypothetical protein